DLLLHRGAARRRLRILLEDSPEVARVLVGHFAVDAPRGLVGRDGVVRYPAAARVLIEVDAGVDLLVHRRDVEARRIGKLRERRGLRKERRGEEEEEQK